MGWLVLAESAVVEQQEASTEWESALPGLDNEGPKLFELANIHMAERAIPWAGQDQLGMGAEECFEVCLD